MPDNDNSNIEDPTPDTLPKVEPVIPKKEPQQESKKDKLSKTQQVKNLINQKLDLGYQLIDKNSMEELVKIICDELKLSINSWKTKLKNIIKEIAIEKKIQISDLGFKNDKIGDMIVTVVKPEQTQQVSSNIQTQSTHSSIGALPKPDSSNKGSLPADDSQTLPEEEQKYMTGTAQKKLIASGLTKIIFPLYTAMGIIEMDESELKEEAKLPKGQQVKKEFEELAGDIDEYLIENEIKLPALLNHLSIIISIFCVLILPIIKFKFFTQKQEPQPDYDDSADNLEVKA